MNTKIKYSLLSFLVLLTLFYIIFLALIPKITDINKFLPDLSKIIKNYSGMELNIEGAKTSVSYNLSSLIKIDKIQVNYPDKTSFLIAQNVKLRLELFPILFKKIKINNVNAQYVKINTPYTKDGEYQLYDILKSLKNSEIKNSNIAYEYRPTPLKIGIKNFQAEIYDEKIKKSGFLNIKDLKFSYKNKKTPISLLGYGDLSYNSKRFINFKINLSVPIFKKNANDLYFSIPEEIRPFNPFINIDKYDLRANINIDLKIKDLNNKLKGLGYINIDSLSYMSANEKVKEGFIHLKLNKSKLLFDINFFASKIDNIKAQISINTSKKDNLEATVKTEKLHLSSIKNTLSTFLDILNLENQTQNIKTEGYFKADFKIKTKNKKIKSSGHLKLIEGALLHKDSGININPLISSISFEDNKIDIESMRAQINNSNLTVQGVVNQDSDFDVKILSEPISITALARTLPRDLIKDYIFSNGTITLNGSLKGKPDNLLPEATVKINDLNFKIKSLKMPIFIKLIELKADQNKEKMNAVLKIINLNTQSAIMPLRLWLPEIKINFGSNDAHISKTPFYLGSSASYLEGKIKNYSSKPEFTFSSRGEIDTKDLLPFFNKNQQKFIFYQGKIKTESLIEGNKENFKIKSSYSTDSNNYISPIEILSFKNKSGLLNVNMEKKDNKLFLNEASFSSDTTKIFTLKGEIDSQNSHEPKINFLKLQIPQEIQIIIPSLQNSKLKIFGSLNFTGNLKSPQITGKINLADIVFPEFKTKIQSASTEFDKNIINFNAKGVDIEDSSLDLEMNISNNLSNSLKITSMAFSSSFIDLDNLLDLSEKIFKNKSTYPITLERGVAQINNLKSGGLTLSSIKSNYAIKNNLIKISDLEAQCASGNLSGKAQYNLKNENTSLDIKLSGGDSRILLGLTGGPNFSTGGIIDIDAKVSFYPKSLEGLSGEINATMQNGEFKKFGRFETFLNAPSLKISDSIISSLSLIETGSFRYLKTKILFKDSMANIQNFESSGPFMSLYAKGNYDLLHDSAELVILGNASNDITSIMQVKNGTLSHLSNEISQKIPPLGSGNFNSRKFLVEVLGPLSSPNAIKTFKWVD